MSLKQVSLGSVSAVGRGITVSGGTNATPIVATLGAGHRLRDGVRIGIAGVTGNTAMNGDWTLKSVGATTATLDGSSGNGTYGGTPAVAVLCDRSPFMARHSAVVVINHPGGAAFVGTVVIEGADRSDGTQFYSSTSSGEVAGFTDALLPGEVAIPAATAGLAIAVEVSLRRYMSLRCSAYTSGTAGASILA